MKALSIFNPFYASTEEIISIAETVRCLRKFSDGKKAECSSTDLERMLTNLLLVQHTLSNDNKKNGLEILNLLDAPELYITPNIIRTGSISIFNAPLATIIQSHNDDEAFLMQMINMLMSGDGIHEHVFLDLASFKNISETFGLKLIEYAEWALAHRHTVNLLWVNESALPITLKARMEMRFKLVLKGQLYLSLGA